MFCYTKIPPIYHSDKKCDVIWDYTTLWIDFYLSYCIQSLLPCEMSAQSALGMTPVQSVRQSGQGLGQVQELGDHLVVVVQARQLRLQARLVAAARRQTEEAQRQAELRAERDQDEELPERV